MSKSLVETLQSAAAHLNDYGQTFWTKELLQNFLAEAHRELQAQLYLSGLPVIKKTSAIIQVVGVASPDSGQKVAVTMTTLSDLLEPITLWERASGSSEDFVECKQKSWEPETQGGDKIIYWDYTGELIYVLAPTTNREVKVRYNASITIPVADEDLLGFTFAELYIAPRTAALAARSIGSRNAYIDLTQLAEKRLEIVIAANIKGQQALPVRRKPYRFSGRLNTIR